jgi:hypothetical protein
VPEATEISFDGVRIDHGPRPFQILQQDDAGAASLTLHGRWRSEGREPATVQARVVSEQDRSPVVPWQSASVQTESTWAHTFDRVPAGGLYRVETRLVVEGAPPEWGLRGDVNHHFGVGDLWVIAGQSNAAGYGRGPVFDPPELGIHILKNDQTWDVAAHPLNDPTGSTHPNREIANPGHSPYLSFARTLHRVLGHPIGLIQTALGNSPLAEWNPTENPDAPLFQNLLHCITLAGGRVRGLLWYQGESDTNPGLAETYERRFADFASHLRNVLDAPRLPIILAQVNRYTGPQSPEERRGWSLVREAQRNARKLGHVAVVPTLDLPLSDDCHTSPEGNLLLGARKAAAALAMVYGRRPTPQFPDIARAVRGIDGRSIELAFSNVPNRLQFIAPGEQDFVVEDERGAAAIREARCVATDRVLLRLERPVSQRARVHGGYGANPPANLRDAEENTPVLAFYGMTIE